MNSITSNKSTLGEKRTRLKRHDGYKKSPPPNFSRVLPN